MSSTGKSATLATCSISDARRGSRSKEFSRRRKFDRLFDSTKINERERDVSWNLGCVVNLGGMGRIYLVVTPVEQGLEGGKN